MKTAIIINTPLHNHRAMKVLESIVLSAIYIAIILAIIPAMLSLLIVAKLIDVLAAKAVVIIKKLKLTTIQLESIIFTQIPTVLQVIVWIVICIAATQEQALAASRACTNFHPGHQFRIQDDSTRNVDGLAILSSTLNLDVKNFNGFLYQINWGMLEMHQGIYDFSRLDQAMALAKRNKKYIRIRVEERTFWSGCNSDFIPSYVSRDTSYAAINTCYAKIWESATMDAYIGVLKALVSRYVNNPYFNGIVTEESVMDASTFQALDLTGTAQYYLIQSELYPQLERLANAVHNAAPDLLFTQYLNWPIYNNITNFNNIAQNLVSLSGGGSVGWPDSVVANEQIWNWYQIPRNFYGKLVIAPSAESGTISSATTLPDLLTDHQAAYNMLVGDLHANIIVWDIWNAALGNNYFTQVVIPTVKNNAAIPNMTCPF